MSLDIALLAYDGANAVDVFAPLQAFASANELASEPVYRLQLIGCHELEVKLATQTRVLCDKTLNDLQQQPPHTLLIAGGNTASHYAQDATIIATLQSLLPTMPRVASICSGAFILAATGALNQRKATTHWARFAEFQCWFPEVQLDIDALFTQDGKYYCSAGVTTGLDLSLHLIQQDYGCWLALETARQMVAFYHRPGGQNQFSSLHGMAETQTPALQDTQRWLHAHLEQTIEVSQLAERSAMSVRHFNRKFTQETGLAPSRYLALARLNKARLLLETTTSSVQRIATQCGYQHAEVMRRLFVRELHVSPLEYRRRFHRYDLPNHLSESI